MEEEEPAATKSGIRKRRGVIKSAITNLGKRLKILEATPDKPGVSKTAKELAVKLEGLDVNFQSIHFELIDLIEEEDEEFAIEQKKLDEHDDNVATLTVRLQQLISRTTSLTDTPTPNRKAPSRKLSRIERALRVTEEAVGLSGSTDASFLEQHAEQLANYKKQLDSIYEELISLDLEDEDDLFTLHESLEKLHFSCAHKVRKQLSSLASSTTSAPVAESKEANVKLPKLDVPTFNGDVLNWKKFWEQFSVSIHDRTNLSKAEKLVYLQQALKGGSAKSTIEGLSRSAAQYDEAIKCLMSRYDRPRCIHHAHVRAILETPALKDGTGKELRQLHDTVQQHMRALKTMECEPSASFLTSMIELKLDSSTSFEWQKHSQDKAEVPHYDELLEFIDLRAQAVETSLQPTNSKKHSRNDGYVKRGSSNKTVPSFTANSDSAGNRCVLCDAERHPIYACSKFKSMSHTDKLSALKKHNLCMNCLGSGHIARHCKSIYKCKKCQRSHHTLLHVDTHTVNNAASSQQTPAPVDNTPSSQSVVSNAAVKLKASSLLMTCRVLIAAPNGSSVEARALLDNGSSASFVSERLVQSLNLPRFHQDIRVSGIVGSSPKSPTRSISMFKISAACCSGRSIDVTAIVVPKVTCDLPVHPVPFDLSWKHLSDLPLADPSFGEPGRVDILLGVDVFIDVLRQGRRTGSPGAPVAFETEFGWVLSGNVASNTPTHAEQVHVHATVFHALTAHESSDEILRRFWEIEESHLNSPLTMDERTVVRHFEANYRRTPEGRFVVPLPRKSSAKAIGESRSQAVRRFVSLERSLNHTGRFQDLDAVIREYLELGHAEKVPYADMYENPSDVFYLPIHAVYKTSSSTTKVRAVFDGSAKSSSGTSLNDILLVGPTVHSPLIDVLLRFRIHRIGLIADVSKMYRAVELVESDRNLHRFVWRSKPEDKLEDYRMTRLTFGVSASSFAANMAVKRNAQELAHEFPLAAEVVEKSFYVDDGLCGADDVETAITLRQQLQDLFSRGCFLLRKWSSNDLSVMRSIPQELCECQDVHPITDAGNHTKTLGLEWNTSTDMFHLTISKSTVPSHVTKRSLISDIARVFDVFGWFSPATIIMKILLQRLWELRLGWDDCVPEEIETSWRRWRMDLSDLSAKGISRCYFPKDAIVCSLELHGYSDASESAYAGVVYLRTVDTGGNVHVSLVISKTRVAPLKKISIPRLELCGAQILASLLQHVKEVLHIPMSNIFAWTDSTIVLCWLSGNPRRLKTYVGNRVASIIDQIPCDRWRHVAGVENPADCASRGLYPQDLLNHSLWWCGPPWLLQTPSHWPQKQEIPESIPPEAREEICLAVCVESQQPVIPLDKYSTFSRLNRVTAWMFRFIENCRVPKTERCLQPALTVPELTIAERYWLMLSQKVRFSTELVLLKLKKPLPRSSCLLSLHPFIDADGLLRVGGRELNAKLAYSQLHPVILHGKHRVSKLIMWSEHLRLLHAGATLLSASLTRRFHIVYLRKTVRSVTRRCITCRRQTTRPQPQLMGQLSLERITPGCVFNKVGVDYAGPFYLKYGMVRKPTVVKAYISIFVSLAVKAVHLEAVSDLTSESFIATLRRFIARRGYPSLIWNDNGTNFTGANRELKELFEFLNQQKTQGVISEFCGARNVEWRFIPEHGPNFGGLWEAGVKATKTHLKRIMGPIKFTYEEFATVLAQVEACLNSRPLVPANSPDDDAIDVLTPGHFLIGQPLCALPDPAMSFRATSLLRRWELCQNVVRHFWKRWSSEYLVALNKFNKWHYPTRNLTVGDVVVLNEDSMLPAKWPLARITHVHPGKDGLVRVVTVRTEKGSYKRPANKVALLLPHSEP